MNVQSGVWQIEFCEINKQHKLVVAKEQVSDAPPTHILGGETLSRFLTTIVAWPGLHASLSSSPTPPRAIRREKLLIASIQ